MMLFDIIHLYRPEGSQTNMKRNMGNFNSHIFHLFQKFSGKVQTGCRSRSLNRHFWHKQSDNGSYLLIYG